jgi:hypothetical protein
MSMITTIRDSLAERRGTRTRRHALERELADLSPAARLELETILEVYPEEQSHELRTVLGRQAVQAA